MYTFLHVQLRSTFKNKNGCHNLSHFCVVHLKQLSHCTTAANHHRSLIPIGWAPHMSITLFPTNVDVAPFCKHNLLTAWYDNINHVSHNLEVKQHKSINLFHFSYFVHIACLHLTVNTVFKNWQRTIFLHSCLRLLRYICTHLTQAIHAWTVSKPQLDLHFSNKLFGIIHKCISRMNLRNFKNKKFAIQLFTDHIKLIHTFTDWYIIWISHWNNEEIVLWRNWEIWDRETQKGWQLGIYPNG